MSLVLMTEMRMRLTLAIRRYSMQQETMEKLKPGRVRNSRKKIRGYWAMMRAWQLIKGRMKPIASIRCLEISKRRTCTVKALARSSTKYKELCKKTRLWTLVVEMTHRHKMKP